MRKSLTLCVLVCISLSCNHLAKNINVETDSTASKYAYTIAKPDNWEVGSTKNTALVLSSLKAYENNKIEECLSYFADTVRWRSDYVEGKFPKDSLRAMFAGIWKEISSMKINMEDFESVISKDKKDEYVTIWWVRTTTDKKGKTDSVAITNDVKISNGKIVALDEAIRHFKPAK
jgi:hypothetical protein